MRNSEKTISANSKGIVISYGDVNKHMFTSYRSEYVKKIQLEGTKKYQKFDQFVLNSVQDELYYKTLYGLSGYTSEELAEMSRSKRSKVIITYTKAHRILNRWKQELINEYVNGFMSKLFPNSPVVKQLVGVNGYDNTLDCSHISFKELGVTRKAIINKLIEFRVLPENFYSLV